MQSTPDWVPSARAPDRLRNACAGDAHPGTEPTSCEEAEGICLELTFDGESCTYEGPATIIAGRATFLYLNESEVDAAANLFVLYGDKTIQDVVDHMGEEPSTKHAPSWSRQINTWAPVPPGESEVWEAELKPGTHGMVCGRWEPHGAWFGAGIEVVD